MLSIVIILSLLGIAYCMLVKSEKEYTTLGAKNESITILIYGIEIILSLLAVLQPGNFEDISSLLLIVSFVALLFSVYVWASQLPVLRAYCAWCNSVFVINMIIFALCWIIYSYGNVGLSVV